MTQSKSLKTINLKKDNKMPGVGGGGNFLNSNA
jgi:hypothetical protein